MKKILAILLVALMLLANIAFAETGRIGVSMPTRSVERWIHDGDKVKESLEELGYTVDLQYAEDIVDAQISQIENMLLKGVDVLIIVAIDGTALNAVLRTAKEMGVTVIAYDRLLMNTKDVDYYATFDSVVIGELQATSVLQGLGVLDGAEGPFNMELFAGSLDDSCSPLYFEGSMNVLQPYIDSGVIVIPSGQVELGQCATEGWDPLKAQARMDNLISANYADGTVLNGVLSPYDGLSIGIISSLKSVGYGTDDLPLPIVSGQDCEIPSIKSIIAGEQYATIFNNTTTLAGVAVDMTLQALKGEEVEVNSTYDNGVFEVPSMSIPATIITAENYEAELVDSGYIAAEDLQ